MKLFVGLFAAIAHCERKGRIRIVRLPFIGPWASKYLLLLRKRLAAPLGRHSRGQSAQEAARTAALKRQVHLLSYITVKRSWQSSGSQDWPPKKTMMESTISGLPLQRLHAKFGLGKAVWRIADWIVHSLWEPTWIIDYHSENSFVMHNSSTLAN